MKAMLIRALPWVCLLYCGLGQDLRKGFEQPPDDARIMMRWWWFGCAVAKPELERELRVMKAAGVGGVEIQPVYPVVLDDPQAGVRNLPYLSDEFIEALRFASDKARELGLRVDITLGSGWPYGGPHVAITEAAGRLRCDRVVVGAGEQWIPMPALENGEKFVAAFLASGGRIELPGRVSGPQTVLVFISSRTGQQVKRAAVNAEGFVLDHYDQAAIEHHLRVVGDRLMQAFGPHPPYAVFSDSLEVYGSDWTADLLEQFQKRRGYDLTPLLPALAGDSGEKTSDVRRDWGRTLTELAEERYLTPIREWAQRHGTRFRSQTYGIPPVILSSNAFVDLPEGEGSQWRNFSTTRWATSASHLYGRSVTSSETWTWLHSPAFRATPLDMKAEADLHFLQGVNQLIGHGWPYSPSSAGEPGWRFYAAAVFNDHNPWFIAMPDMARYFQRISFLLRQGKPANDVAVYLPTEDAWAGFTLGHDSVNQAMGALLGADVVPQILDAGFNFDFIDDRAIEQVGLPYPVLVMPIVKRLARATAQKIEEYKRRGGIVVEASRLGELSHLYNPDFFTGEPAIGFIHRKMVDSDVYFVVNTGNRAVHATARVRVAQGREGEWWNPVSGRVSRAGGSTVELTMAPYESRVLVYPSHSAVESGRSTGVGRTIDISSDWRVSFTGMGQAIEMHELRSWSDDEATRYYSGRAVYEKTIVVPGFVGEAVLDFGEGTAVEPIRMANGMRAWLESPVREAAVVFVNGKRVGSVWCPPYEMDVTEALRAGSNEIRVEVGNLAINEMAGQALPDYELLNLRYGVRFQPQDMEGLKPLLSGMLGGVRLVMR